MAKEKLCGIYCIENLIDNKKYIGQSVNIKERWYHHKRRLRNGNHYNNHLQSSWNKYGEENFLFYIIEECSEYELDAKEEYHISKYNSLEFGYNQRPGGNTSNMTKEQKTKIGLSNKNKIRSSEFKEHLSKVNKGRAFRHKVVKQSTLDHKLLNTYFSIAEASRKTGISYWLIRSACNGENINSQTSSYIWEFD